MSALFSRVMRFAIDAIQKLHSLFVALWLLPVRFYRRFLSGWKPPSCRFRPTCSAYAIDAVNEWGILIGTVLTVCRIFRCNPFSRGGCDPVPKRADFLARLKRLRKK